MAFAVAIISFNTREHLRTCLGSVDPEAADVIVVDNASTDGSAEMVRTEFPGVRLVANARNVGYGAAANQAMRVCGARYVLLLNSDTVLRPGALEALGAYLEEHRRTAIVGPRLVNPDGTLQPSCRPFPTPLKTLLELSILGRLLGYVPFVRDRYLCTWPHTSARAVPWVKGAVLAIRREAFEEVGGFDEAYFMYSEEVDLCYRLNAAGWQVHFAPVATVVHTGGASTVQLRPEMTVQLFESILRFYRRHHSGLRFAEMAIIVKFLMVARLLRDTPRLLFERDVRKRAEVSADIAVWQRVLFAHSEE